MGEGHSPSERTSLSKIHLVYSLRHPIQRGYNREYRSMAKSFFLRRNGSEEGPFSASHLQLLARTNQISPKNAIRREDSDRWVLAADVKGLFPPADTQKPMDPLAGPNQSKVRPRGKKWLLGAVAVGIILTALWMTGVFSGSAPVITNTTPAEGGIPRIADSSDAPPAEGDIPHNADSGEEAIYRALARRNDERALVPLMEIVRDQDAEHWGWPLLRSLARPERRSLITKEIYDPSIGYGTHSTYANAYPNADVAVELIAPLADSTSLEPLVHYLVEQGGMPLELYATDKFIGGFSHESYNRILWMKS